MATSVTRDQVSRLTKREANISARRRKPRPIPAYGNGQVSVMTGAGGGTL